MFLIIHYILYHQDYKRACDVLFDGFKLDPENAEIENALRYVYVALHCGMHASTSIIFVSFIFNKCYFCQTCIFIPCPQSVEIANITLRLSVCIGVGRDKIPYKATSENPPQSPPIRCKLNKKPQV